MQAIYDAIDAELTIDLEPEGDGAFTRLVRSLRSLYDTASGAADKQAFITVDARGVTDLLGRAQRLEAAFRDVGSGSLLGDAIEDRLGEIAGDAAENVRALAPVDSGLLRDYGIRSEVVRRKRAIVARVLAHARGKEAYNYAWFTEVGTQNHAVDDLGYEHSTSRPAGNHRGIPAQHWFERGSTSVLDDAEEVVSSVIDRVVATVLGT